MRSMEMSTRGPLSLLIYSEGVGLQRKYHIWYLRCTSTSAVNALILWAGPPLMVRPLSCFMDTKDHIPQGHPACYFECIKQKFVLVCCFLFVLMCWCAWYGRQGWVSFWLPDLMNLVRFNFFMVPALYLVPVLEGTNVLLLHIITIS